MRHSLAPLALLLAALAPMPAPAQNMPNPYGPSIGVEAAHKAVAAALAEARKNGWVVYGVVVEPGGTLVHLDRLDGAQTASADVAIAKARSAVSFKRPTKAFEEALVGGRLAVLGLPGAIPLEGGIPIVAGGKIIGAIGVSGATSAQDGQCAKAGVEALEPPRK